MHRTAPAIAACLGLLALAPSASARSSPCSDAPTYERTVVCLVNAERRAHGRRGLDLSRRLAYAADRHAADMVARRYFSHRGAGGSGPADRARSSGYASRTGRWTVGEALAYGTGRLGAPRRIVRAWMRSPGHRAVVLYAPAEHIGVGAVAGTPSGGRGVTVALEVGRR